MIQHYKDYIYRRQKHHHWYLWRNAQIFIRNTVRDTYRRGLLMNISSAMNGSQLDYYSYAYDALKRHRF